MATMTDSNPGDSMTGDQRSAGVEPTRGPWRVCERASSRVLAGENDTVATTGCQSNLRDQWEANARLIAAAPDMLAAGKALLADVRRRYPGEELRREFMRALDAAIAKAEGR